LPIRRPSQLALDQEVDVIRIGIRHATSREVGGQLPPVVIPMRQEMVNDVRHSRMIFLAWRTSEVNDVLQARVDELPKCVGVRREALHEAFADAVAELNGY
jgi:hypothetical protein